jgi:uncharacterized protein YegP (UPF0339 family)
MQMMTQSIKREVIASSEQYSSIASRKKRIESVKKNGAKEVVKVDD